MIGISKGSFATESESTSLQAIILLGACTIDAVDWPHVVVMNTMTEVTDNNLGTVHSDLDGHVSTT